jgi:serine/threonine-protein kinase
VAQDDAQTIVGPIAPAPAAKPVTPQKSTAAGVATPPPGSMSSQASRFARPPAAGISHDFEPGDDFGPRYRIESLIGEGGMGKVYKAYDKELDRIVALKLVRSELARDPASMQRFKQELLLASRISHKNILRIHDLGDVEGTKFISMTYVEGEDLDDVLRREGRLPLDRAIGIAKKLCGALEAAQAEGVAHRDLKPRNILIDRADNVYISDFGLAKSLEANASAMTRTGEILGTPRYMSPEQAEALPTDHRSDIYSFGLIFYEMVTGEVPFRGDSMMQVMYQRVTQPPKNPQLVVPDLPDSITAIIMRCLEKNLERRYQSAGEILRDLEAGSATAAPEGSGASWPAIPQAPAPVATKPAPGRRGWLIASGAAALAIALTMAIPSVRNLVLKRPLGSGAAAPAPEKYMAILPFRVGDDAKLKYQADGVVESLSAKLFQLKNVHLASTSAVETAAKQGSSDKIAHELGVTLLLQGTVQGAGDKISIAVTMEDVAAKKRVWSQEFSGLRQDLLTVQDEIYNKLVAALDLKLDNEELARGAMRPTEDIGAYDLYLRARSLIQSKKDEKTVKGALDLYEQAIKKDPRFALAYAGLSVACLDMYNSTKDNLWTEKALSSAQQAQRLNDNLPEAHFSLGGIYVVTGKTAEAVVELKRALELAPNSDEGYRRLGTAYRDSGRKVEAIRAYEKAVQVNPYYWRNHNQLGIGYYRFAEYEKAIAAFRHVLQLDPNNADAYRNLGAAYSREAKWNECIQAFQKSLQLNQSPGIYQNLGVVYLYQRNYAEAIKVLQKAVELAPNEQLFVGTLANGYRYSGQKEKAMLLYDRAIALCFKAFQVNPKDTGNLSYLALYHAKKGDQSRAVEYIRRARSINSNDSDLIYKEAVIHAIADNGPEALASLREAFQKGYTPEEAKDDPELKTLRVNPEFDKLLKEFSRKAN